MIKLLEKLRLRTQLILWFSLIYALGFIVFGFVLGRNLGNELQIEENEKLDRIMEQTSILLTRIIDAEDVETVLEEDGLNNPSGGDLIEALGLAADSDDLVTAAYIVIPSDEHGLLYIVGEQYIDIGDPVDRGFLEPVFVDDEEAEAEMGWINDALLDGETVVSPFLYETEDGTRWTDGFSPIENAEGEIVALVGVQVIADELIELQSFTWETVGIAGAVILPILFAAIFLVSGRITRPIDTITKAAKELEEADSFDPATLEQVSARGDEIGNLARIFSRMAKEVIRREEQLRMQVATLKIEIDEQKRAEEVAEITESDYFKELQEKSRAMRNAKRNKPSSKGEGT